MLAVVGCGGSDTTKRDTSVGGSGGEVAPPVGVVKVDQAVLAFGSVDIGTTAAAKTVTVTVTVAPVALNATVVGDGFNIAASSCAATQPVGSCTISVNFAPTRVGAATGTLTVGPAAVALSGTGTQPGVFSASPESIPLGTLLVGAAAQAVVNIVPVGTVPSLSCLPSGADLALATQTCPLTGAVSTQCTYTFTFKATTPGDKVDAIVCSGGGTVRNVSVTATVITPAALSINPTKQDLTVQVKQSVAWTFNVSNAGGAATGTLGATITGAGFSITGNDCPPQLAGGGMCKIQVTFAPTATGKVTGALTVTDVTAPATPAVATLTGTGIDSKVTITPLTKDFATVEVGKSATAAFTMVNGGSSATGIIALTSPDAQFAVVSDLCSSHALEVNGQCTFAVTFAPASPGLKQAMVNAIQTSDNAFLASVSLSGTGQAAPTAPRLSVSPPTLDFGTTGVGVSVGPKTFTITNVGGTATGALTTLKNDSTSSVGGASQFNITGNTCTAALAPNASCQVAVTFAPTITRSASAVIVVGDGVVSTSDGATGTPPGTVVGIALGIPVLDLDCAPTVTFADTVVGKTSPNVVCTVTNNPVSGGDTPQESGAITPTATGDFAVAVNNCTASLQVNMRCTLGLVFKPTVKGPRTGMLTVTSANRGANNADLKGVGLGVVEIVEVADGEIVDPQPYDFGQVAVGSWSTKVVTLGVYVRADVGNINVTGAFGQPAAFTLTGTADLPVYSDGGTGPCGLAACTSIPACDSSITPTVSVTKPSCYKIVNFIPQARTLVNGTITASDGTGSAKDTATVKGTGTGPLVISPSPVDFGDVAKGAVGLVTLKVTNKGATPMKAFALTITGTNADAFFVQQDGLSGLSQLPGVGCGVAPTTCNVGTVVLGFNPETTAAAAATFTVTTAVYDATGTNPVGNESGEVALIGNGVVGASITATTSDTFPSTFAGARSATAITVTVQNAANAQTTGQLKISLVAGASSDFDLTYDSSHTAGTCWNVSSTSGLPAGGTCTILVWFKPRTGLAIAARSDTLQVLASPGGVATLALKGTALAQLELTASDSQHQGTAASPYDFGTLVINSTSSKTLTFTVTNHADTDVARGAVNISYANATNWPILPSSLFSVDSTGTTGCQGNATTNIAIAKNGGTCTFTATATGATASPGVGFKQFRVDAGGSQVALADTTATAVEEAKVQLTAATDYSGSTLPLVARNIGTVPLNSTSNPVKFTLVNIGGTSAKALTGALYATGTNTKLVAADNSPYAIAAAPTSSCLNLAEGGLAPGAHCDFVVVYQPTNAHPDPTAGQVDLVITADNGFGSPAVPIRQVIAATRTAASSAYLGDASNKAAADMGTMTADVFSTQVVFYNGTGADITLASLGTATVASPTGAGTFGSAAVTTGTTGGCTTTGAVHANGGSCTLTVTYDTAAVATATTRAPGWHVLTLTTGGASLTLFAYVPAGEDLNLEPAAFALGTPTSAQSANQTVQVVNIGNKAVTVTAATPSPIANLVVSGCPARLCSRSACARSRWPRSRPLARRGRGQ